MVRYKVLSATERGLAAEEEVAVMTRVVSCSMQQLEVGWIK